MSLLLRQLLIASASGFLVGVLGASLIKIGTAYLLFCLLLGGVLGVVSFWTSQSRIIFLSVAFIFLGLALGVFRVGLVADTGDLSAQVGQAVELSGVVVAEPDSRDTSTFLVFRPTGATSNILVSTDVYQEFNYGDQLTVKGKIELPKNFDTDTGKIFDYINYLRVRNIYYQISFAKITKIDSGQGNLLLSSLFKIKKVFTSHLDKSLGEPEASLMSGLLVGDRRGLGQGLQTDFRRAGLIHIVVLSGYNMTVIAEALIFVLASFWSLTSSLMVGAVGIVLFALLTGGGATVFRASVMALLAILARLTGRLYDASIGLFLAGTVMILWNPLLLVFDVGFQLSFLATLGLIYLSPIVERQFKSWPKAFGLKEVLVTTISAQVAVLPWLVYVMGEFSLVSLPVNILVLPFIPLTMFLGFVTGVAHFIFPLLSVLPAGLTNIFLSYVLGVVKISASLPFATIRFDYLSPVLVLVAYLGLIIFIFWANYKYQQVTK